MTDILQRLVDAQLDHNVWKWGWAGDAADEIRKLRLEYKAMTRSRDEWQSMAARRTANLEQYSRRAENDIAEMARERDKWKAAAQASYGNDLEQALSERDALVVEAARYRYLRDRNRDDVLLKSGPSAGVWCDCENDGGDLILLTGSDLDAATDAALAVKD